MNTVFLEIGGNLNNRLKNIVCTKKLIATKIGLIETQSSIYETPPWGFESANNFYNQVLKIQTELNACELLEACHSIENKLGRVRGAKQFMSRTIDLDILFFNNEIINTYNLQIPHPRLHLRKFVLIPLNEIVPNFIHPKYKKSISCLLLECDDKSELKKLNL